MSGQGPRIVHRAKVDRWLSALMAGLMLVELFAAVALLVGDLDPADSRSERAITAAILAGTGLFFGVILWVCYRTRYEITPSQLVIRFGPFHTALPLGAITAVRPSHNLLAAPAPSLDRLRIDYTRAGGGGWFALVAPADKQAFVRDLADAAPQLRVVPDEPLQLTV